ncbi:DJ-1/PfpI family protein [Candidatus Aerophobetes bacterium]|nr:DJ-1/PfpI family protein [Candidatus Aerophobetes bacterium]
MKRADETKRDYADNPGDKLKSKRVLILCAPEFEDVELLYPILRLSEEGAAVTVAILEKEGAHSHTRAWWEDKPISGRAGCTVPIVALAEGERYNLTGMPQAKPEDYDVVIIPGGFAPDYLRCDRTTLKLVADMYKMGKIVAAICHGPQVLISADVVLGTDMIRGRNVTCWDAVIDDIKNAGGNFEALPARRDGNVITGRLPDALPQFIQAVMEALAE